MKYISSNLHVIGVFTLVFLLSLLRELLSWFGVEEVGVTSGLFPFLALGVDFKVDSVSLSGSSSTEQR